MRIVLYCAINRVSAMYHTLLYYVQSIYLLHFDIDLYYDIGLQHPPNESNRENPMGHSNS